MKMNSDKARWTTLDESKYSLYRKLAETMPPNFLDETPATPANLAMAEKIALWSERLKTWPAYAIMIGLAITVFWRTGELGAAFVSTIALGLPIAGICMLIAWVLRKLLQFDKRYGHLISLAERHRENENRLARHTQNSREAIEALVELEVRRNAYIAEQELQAAELLEENKRRVASKDCAEHWRAMRGYDLEHQLEVLFTCAGFSVTRQGKSGDHGVDLALIRHGRSIAVQSKGWGNAVGPATVRELIGARHIHSASEAWLVAVGGVTAGAAKLAKDHDIRIVSADDLADYAKEFGQSITHADLSGIASRPSVGEIGN